MTAQAGWQINESLRHSVQRALAAFPVLAHDTDDHHHAAVALTLVEGGHGADLDGLPRGAGWTDAAALVLTRRSLSLRKHAGQWALPGGRLDEGETPEVAALRELEEEVGLALGADCVLGRLDDFTTRSGFVITPVVVWGGAARAMARNPAEVESIHRIPVAEFMREDAPRLEVQEGSEQPVLRMPVGSGDIAAPTAALLYQFREVVLCGRHTRVGHYEQPHFAWR